MISTWAGLRPLIADPKGRPSDISRSHEIKSPQPGWWDAAGGKLTTCRLMAEQTVDKLTRASDLRALPCSTAVEPIVPQPEYSGIVPPEFGEAAVRHFCENEWARHLDDIMIRRTSWHHYHREAGQMARQAAEWMAPLLGWNSAQTQREIEHYLNP